jgi:hypothetical protein
MNFKIYRLGKRPSFWLVDVYYELLDGTQNRKGFYKCNRKVFNIFCDTFYYI